MIFLPTPPTVNNLWMNLRRGGRARTSEYNAWIAAARARLGPVKQFSIAVEIEMQASRNGRRDIDGYIKPVVDLLVTAGLLINDRERFVEAVTARWHDEPHEDIIVIIKPTIDRPVPKPPQPKKPKPLDLGQRPRSLTKIKITKTPKLFA